MSGAHGAAVARGERTVGPLDGLAPEAKLGGLLAFLLVSAVTPTGRMGVLAAQAGIAVLIAAVAATPARSLLRRLALDLPLLALAVTYAVAGRGPRTTILGLSLSATGMRVGLAVLMKATIGIIAVSAVAATTPVGQLVAGLRRLSLPGWVCDLVGLAVRQADVLADDVERLRLAAAVRSGDRGRRVEWAAVARALGVSFVRATERSDRLQLAALARGGATLGAVVVPAADLAVATARMWALASLPAAAALAIRLAT